MQEDNDIKIVSANKLFSKPLQTLVSDSTNLITLTLDELKSDMENLINVLKQTNRMD